MVALLHDNKHELRLVVLPAGGDTGAADGGHLVRGCCVVRAVARREMRSEQKERGSAVAAFGELTHTHVRVDAEGTIALRVKGCVHTRARAPQHGSSAMTRTSEVGNPPGRRESEKVVEASLFGVQLATRYAEVRASAPQPQTHQPECPLSPAALEQHLAKSRIVSKRSRSHTHTSCSRRSESAHGQLKLIHAACDTGQSLHPTLLL